MATPRFQFRLRTLFLVVTILAIPCAYVGWQMKLVAERERLLNTVEAVIPGRLVDDAALPVLRQWLGDRSCLAIGLADSESDKTIERYRRAFPEAIVVRMEKFPEAHSELVRAGKADWLPTPAP